MIQLPAIWCILGFVGALLWLWAEWDYRHTENVPMWWRIFYPTLLGPFGFAIGTILAVSRWRRPT